MGLLWCLDVGGNVSGLIEYVIEGFYLLFIIIFYNYPHVSTLQDSDTREVDATQIVQGRQARQRSGLRMVIVVLPYG